MVIPFWNRNSRYVSTTAGLLSRPLNDSSLQKREHLLTAKLKSLFSNCIYHLESFPETMASQSIHYYPAYLKIPSKKSPRNEIFLSEIKVLGDNGSFDNSTQSTQINQIHL